MVRITYCCSEDEVSDNPMVAQFQDDLDSEDDVAVMSNNFTHVQINSRVSSRGIELSSDEESTLYSKFIEKLYPRFVL